MLREGTHPASQPKWGQSREGPQTALIFGEREPKSLVAEAEVTPYAPRRARSAAVGGSSEMGSLGVTVAERFSARVEVRPARSRWA